MTPADPLRKKKSSSSTKRLTLDLGEQLSVDDEVRFGRPAEGCIAGQHHEERRREGLCRLQGQGSGREKKEKEMFNK